MRRPDLGDLAGLHEMLGEIRSPYPREAVRGILANALSGPDSIVLVAARGEQLLGFVAAEEQRAPIGWICVVLLARSRSRQAGNALYAQVERWAHRRGHRQIAGGYCGRQEAALMRRWGLRREWVWMVKDLED